MATTLALDPRIQVPDSVTLRDDDHPLNVIRQTTEIQNQASMDSMYDIPTPERFRKREGFRSFQGPNDIILVIGILVFLAIFWVYVRNTTRPLYVFIVLLAFAALMFLRE